LPRCWGARAADRAAAPPPGSAPTQEQEGRHRHGPANRLQPAPHLDVDDRGVGLQHVAQVVADGLLVGAQLGLLGNDGGIQVAQHVATLLRQGVAAQRGSRQVIPETQGWARAASQAMHGGGAARQRRRVDATGAGRGRGCARRCCRARACMSRTASLRKMSLLAPFHLGSVSGKSWPA
jgi:hypothetical protein